jgi:hypothetical protein
MTLLTSNPGLVQITGENISTRSGFAALLSQWASAQPSAIQVAEYTSSNTAAPTCQTLVLKGYGDEHKGKGDDVIVSPVLPVIPSPELCNCMMRSLDCHMSNVPRNQTNTVYKGLCEKDPLLCSGVQRNFTSGIYGAFGQCNITEVASWVTNQRFLSQGKDPTACAAVNGTIQQAVPSASQGSRCKMLLSQAKSDGSGTITAFPDYDDESTAFNSGKSKTTFSTGTKVGITISLIVVGSFIIGATVWFQRRRTAKKKAEIRSSLTRETYEKFELPDEKISNIGRIPEVYGGERVEMEAESKPGELVAQENQIHELEAHHGASEK